MSFRSTVQVCWYVSVISAYEFGVRDEDVRARLRLSLDTTFDRNV